MMTALVQAIENGALPEQCTPSLNLGGLIFSDYSRRPKEHALHWSKAQSMFSYISAVVYIVIMFAKCTRNVHVLTVYVSKWILTLKDLFYCIGIFY